MIRRLVDAHYDEFKGQANEDRVRFGLRESRTSEVLLAVAVSYSRLCEERWTDEHFLACWGLDCESKHDARGLARIRVDRKKEADRSYWQLLKQELASLRREKRKQD